MLYVSLPTREEVLSLAEMRSDWCVSIYLKVSPLPKDAAAGKVELMNMIRDAFDILRDSGMEKRELDAFCEELTDVVDDGDFWAFHARGLAVLAAPGFIRTYRLANNLSSKIQVADRFFLKPLLRALTFPHNAYVLALSENEARLVEFFADAPPEVVDVPGMPEDALSAIGRPSLNYTVAAIPAGAGRGAKMRLAQYSRKVDTALRPLLMHNNTPLILVSTVLLDSIFRSVASMPNLLKETVFTSTDRISVSELVELARPVLDRYYVEQVTEIKALFEERTGQDRTATDLALIAKAATYGMVSYLMVDFEKDVKGFIDDDNGVISFAEEEEGAYSLTDEIVKRALACGAEVMALREDDMIGDTGAAAILRYSL